MQKTFITSLLNAEHIVTEKILFTFFYKSIAIKKLIIFVFIFLKKNLIFNTVLKMINQMMKKLA